MVDKEGCYCLSNVLNVIKAYNLDYEDTVLAYLHNWWFIWRSFSTTSSKYNSTWTFNQKDLKNNNVLLVE
jgi:hypothetical protein